MEEKMGILSRTDIEIEGYFTLEELATMNQLSREGRIHSGDTIRVSPGFISVIPEMKVRVSHCLVCDVFSPFDHRPYSEREGNADIEFKLKENNRV